MYNNNINHNNTIKVKEKLHFVQKMKNDEEEICFVYIDSQGSTPIDIRSKIYVIQDYCIINLYYYILYESINKQLTN